MALRHIVLLTVRDRTTDEQLDAIVEALRALPGQIPELVSYVVGRDAGLAEGNADLCAVADFATEADYQVYRDHPAHQAVIQDLILPVLAGRTALQHRT